MLEVCMILVGFFFLLFYVFNILFLDERLKLLTAENISLVVNGMFPVVLREIAVEETALINDKVVAVSSEREALLRAFRESGGNFDVGSPSEEVKELARLSEGIGRRLADLSSLEMIVKELHGLEGGASDYAGYTLEGLQGILSDVTTDADNVLVDWCGDICID